MTSKEQHVAAQVEKAYQLIKEARRYKLPATVKRLLEQAQDALHYTYEDEKQPSVDEL